MKKAQNLYIDLIPKPRMTKSDKWKKRDCVVRYFEFKDKIRKSRISLPEHYHVYFIKGMPKSWSKKKKASMHGQPHRQKPDKDNLEKALLDALHKEDSHIYDGRVTKLWGSRDQIIIYEIEPPMELLKTEI